MKAIFVLGLCLSAVLALPASRRRLKSLVDDHADDPRYYYRNDDSSDKSKSSYYYRNDDSSEKGKSSYYYRNGDSSENGKARYYYRNDDSSDNSEARYYYRNDDSSDKAKSSYYYRNDDSSDNSKTSDLDVLAKELDRLATVYRGQGVPPHVRDQQLQSGKLELQILIVPYIMIRSREKPTFVMTSLKVITNTINKFEVLP
ncbi:unnamed protein product [Leptidea sinapis]|uniref:Uncharacterized protein n=1 Tax=Leptidea sinapis TaxID=189913 RepID=A0A5E4QHJ0_9NEOP|nr:unnamed protein product [Leptidea sinapis]